MIEAIGYWLGRRVADAASLLPQMEHPQENIWDYRARFVDIFEPISYEEMNDLAVDTIKELQENLKPRRGPRQNWPNE